MLHFFTKMGKMPDLDWTQHIKMGWYPKFEEKPINGQNKTLSMFLDKTACPFQSAMLQNQEFAVISQNLVKIAFLKEILAIVNLETIENI